jgi:hypothetical protein
VPGRPRPRGTDAAAALTRLCQDADIDTRYYALYAATREVAGMNTAKMTELTGRLMHDPDDQIQTMAAAHHTAIRDVRQLLNEWDFLSVVHPPNDTDAYDRMIGSLLTALAQEVDATGIRRLLDDEIHRHLGLSPADADTPGLAERLITWWQEDESR